MGCIVEQQGGDEDAVGIGWKWNETGLAGCGGDGDDFHPRAGL